MNESLYIWSPTPSLCHCTLTRLNVELVIWSVQPPYSPIQRRTSMSKLVSSVYNSTHPYNVSPRQTPFPYRIVMSLKNELFLQLLNFIIYSVVEFAITSFSSLHPTHPTSKLCEISRKSLHVYHLCDQPNMLSSLFPQTIRYMDLLITATTISSMAPWFTNKSSQVKCEHGFINQSPILSVTYL
jgi:hypothetical protein